MGNGRGQSNGGEAWDGSEHDVGVMGMWDGLGIEGPSCLRLPPLEQCTLQDLEATYAQAKNTYFSGQPVVSDAMFDQVEKRLVRAGSAGSVGRV